MDNVGHSLPGLEQRVEPAFELHPEIYTQLRRLAAARLARQPPWSMKLGRGLPVERIARSGPGPSYSTRLPWPCGTSSLNMPGASSDATASRVVEKQSQSEKRCSYSQRQRQVRATGIISVDRLDSDESTTTILTGELPL